MPHLSPLKRFGQRVREARLNAGLSQQRAADSIGVTRVTWAKWEVGYHNPPIERFRELCVLLGVSADHLLGLR